MKLKFSQLAKAVLCTAAMAVSALGSMTISASAADNINVNIVCKMIQRLLVMPSGVYIRSVSVKKLTLSLPESSAIIL